MFKFKAGDLLKIKEEYLPVPAEIEQFSVYLVVKADENILFYNGAKTAQRYYDLLTDEQIRAWSADNIEAVCVRIGEKEE